MDFIEEYGKEHQDVVEVMVENIPTPNIPPGEYPHISITINTKISL